MPQVLAPERGRALRGVFARGGSAPINSAGLYLSWAQGVK
jgi:hypothetical protein